MATFFGGDIAPAKVFANNSNRRIGFVGYWGSAASCEFAKRATIALSDCRGDGERGFRFETYAMCLKYRYPILRGPICGAFYLRAFGVPYRPYGRLAPKFQTLAPRFEVKGGLAVPVARREV